MIAFIVARGSHTSVLQTEISLRGILPEISPVLLPETDTATTLNDVIATYEEPFFLTLYAGFTVKPEFKDLLQRCLTDIHPDSAGIVIRSLSAHSDEHTLDIDQPFAALWRTAAVKSGPHAGFTKRSHLPFDHYVLLDKYYQLLHSSSWQLKATDTLVPGRANNLQQKRNQLEKNELLPLIKRSGTPCSPHQNSLNNPIISIVICTYNDAGYLPWAVRSVLAQSYLPWELLIVDDGSIDETKAYLKTLALDRRIRCIIQGHNQGKAACLNIALNEAKGSWMLELDADDWLTVNSLQKLAETASSLDRPGVIYADHHIWVERNNGQLIYRGLQYSPQHLTYGNLLEGGLAIAPRFYYTQLLKDNNGWNTSVPWGGRLYEDIEILTRLARKEPFHYIPLPLYNRRIRSSSITHVHDKHYEFWRNWMLNQNFQNF